MYWMGTGGKGRDKAQGTRHKEGPRIKIQEGRKERRHKSYAACAFFVTSLSLYLLCFLVPCTLCLESFPTFFLQILKANGGSLCTTKQ
jgi:hypothetical protein